MQPSQNEPVRWKRQAALFLASQNISLFGSSVVAYAMIWYITLKTSSGVWMMLSTLCTMVPQVVVSLFGGVLADRYSRKWLIMLSDGFIAFATLGMAIAFLLGYQRLELLLVIAALRSVGSGMQSPAVGAIYPQLVPQDKLTKVQGINQTIYAVLNLLAPPVAGVILGSVGITATFFVDVSTALLAIVVMSFIRVEKVPRKEEEPLSLWGDMRAGLRYTLGNRTLRRIILCFTASFFLITPAAVLSPLLVQRTFGSDVWMLTANEVSWTLGSLAGGVFVSLKGEFRDKVLTVAVCMIAFGVLFSLLGIAWDLTSYLIFMGVAGCFLPAVITAQTVHIQEVAEAGVLGRVFSIVDIVSASAMPVAILVFGPLADVVSVQVLLVVSGVLLALAGVWYGWAGKPRAGTTPTAPGSQADLQTEPPAALEE